jgi:DNA-binding response OmpR family regulator
VEAFELVHISELAEALEYLSRENPDAMLLDLVLAASSGLDTFRTVRTLSPHLPIIIITGLSDEALVSSALRECAQDYLVKGQTDANLLVRTIRYAIGRKQAEEKINRYAEQLAVVADIEHSLAVSLDQAAIYENLAQGIQRLLADIAAIFISALTHNAQ